MLRPLSPEQIKKCFQSTVTQYSSTPIMTRKNLDSMGNPIRNARNLCQGKMHTIGAGAVVFLLVGTARTPNNVIEVGAWLH